MKRFGKKKSLLLASSLYLGACLTMVPVSGIVNAADDGKHIKQDDPDANEIQFICDQKTVGTDATIPLKILYHNVQNKNHDNVWLKVKVPNGLKVDPKDCDGAVWDATTRVLEWNFKNVSIGYTTVIHLQFTIDATVAIGTNFDLSCSSDNGDGDFYTTPSCSFTVGTEIDQPFFSGYPDGNFHPTAFITRAEAATVVARALQLPNGSTTKAYWDVPSGYWASRYINEVTNAGYMQGYPDGSFHPDAYLTRAELVSLLLSIRGIYPVDVNGFGDTEHHWAKDKVGTAKELGYVDGVSKDYFAPDAFTQRQEAAKLFDIALNRGPLVNGTISVQQHFPDVPKTSWAFNWVEEGAKVAHESVRKGPYEYLIRYLPSTVQ